MARLIVIIGPVSKRYISFVALKMLSGNLLRIENRKEYLWNRKLERCALHNYTQATETSPINPYPTAFPYGNGMVLHFYQQQESSTTKTVHKVINKGLKAYV